MKWQRNSPTYSIDLWRWVARERGLPDSRLRDEFIKRIANEETAESAAFDLYRAFKLFANMFFERYRVLQELDRLFGDQLGAQLYGLPVRNICTGLIVSKLAGRPGFSTICDSALEKVSALGDSISVERVRCLIKVLGGDKSTHREK
ncbi:MAG: hypothetical protein M3Y79_07020 [Pseudomonadota bacterium]|nr:hypothetical protein [Pseudomonadota bacterium]